MYFLAGFIIMVASWGLGLFFDVKNIVEQRAYYYGIGFVAGLISGAFFCLGVLQLR